MSSSACEVDLVGAVPYRLNALIANHTVYYAMHVPRRRDL